MGRVSTAGLWLKEVAAGGARDEDDDIVSRSSAADFVLL